MAAGALKSLDAFLPAYEFSERHRTRVQAPAERVDSVLRSLSADDIALVRVLFRLRGLKRRGGPFVEQARRLDDVRGEGLVLGLRGDFWRLRGGGSACEAVVDFRIDGETLSTETRVHVEDPIARRKFARYWRVIRPFSGLTRILFLREVRRRAEGT